MDCRACHARLEYNDNYCRKCGAAVDIVEVEVIRSLPARQVSAIATLRQAALPVVAQSATMLVAGTLVKFALRQLFARRDTAPRHLLPFGRPGGDGDFEELLYIRRSRAR
jgi:predicted amidophosphoribosyltransferase